MALRLSCFPAELSRAQTSHLSPPVFPSHVSWEFDVLRSKTAQGWVHAVQWREPCSPMSHMGQ